LECEFNNKAFEISSLENFNINCHPIYGVDELKIKRLAAKKPLHAITL